MPSPSAVGLLLPVHDFVIASTKKKPSRLERFSIQTIAWLVASTWSSCAPFGKVWNSAM